MTRLGVACDEKKNVVWFQEKMTSSSLKICGHSYLWVKTIKLIILLQITGLPHGLKGACLHTNLSKAQRQKVVDDLCSGKVSVLLLSPEALVGGGSGNGCLPSVSQLPQIGFACIDEAHCVSEWSHNFRPSYLRVCKVSAVSTPNRNIIRF